MLRSLNIRNYAIIDDIELSLDDNLNIITGETGAGKSIIIGALGLIMGNRSDSKVLYNEDRKCIIEAVFSNIPPSISDILSEADLDDDNELIIRREIVPSGKSRAFVNDTPTTLKVLQEISLQLIDLNAQFQLNDLYKSDFYISIIDAMAGHSPVVDNYRNLYKTYSVAKRELESLENSESTQIKEMDFMKFQLGELTETGLSIEEQSQLESESALLEKAEDISTLIEETKYVLTDSDNNIKEIISQLAIKWERIRGMSPKIDENLDRFSELDDMIHHIVNDIDGLASSAENDPTRLLEIQDRLSTIYNLQKKHGVNSIKELIDISVQLQKNISSYESRSDTIIQLKDDIKSQNIELQHIANKISKSRKKVIPKLQKQVNERMEDLAMASAAIKIECKPHDIINRQGIDDISILFKANKGGHFQPIRKVASGGESARLMLSLKSAVAKKMSMPTMIFDEIDTGISGDIAGKIGLIIKEMADSHQIICITHSPQVASKADKHYFVYKEDSTDKTITNVRELSKKDKVTEIAKMLSGNPPSTYALKNAKELLSI